MGKDSRNNKSQFFSYSHISNYHSIMLINKKFGLIVFITTLFFGLPVKASTKSVASFALVGSTGVIPLADNPVVIIPCAPINKNCMLIKDYLLTTLNNTEALDELAIKKLDTNIRTELNKLTNSEIVRTNLSGNASIQCPTQNCLIFSSAFGEKKLFWIDLFPAGTSQEYPPSRAVEIKTQVIPSEISGLVSAINSFSSALSAGLSLSTFSSQYAPFLNAIRLIENYESDERFMRGIKEVKKSAILFSILQDTWQAYVDATKVERFFGKTHFVDCKWYNENIRKRWNDTLGYEDLKPPHRGIFGCVSVNLDGIHSYMYKIASSQLSSSIAYLQPKASKIPDIQFLNLSP
ncbi:MAG: hypothetical protein KGR70_14580 [Cyanobacteria bacterium REEB494]|nr:hypothetical protein [Cyanobacteria bacterium REEB494]